MLTADAISLKQVRWSWLPRDEVAHARVDGYGVEVATLGGQTYSSTVYPIRVILRPSLYDRAEEMRDAINEWAGTTDPTPPPVNDPPPHDWSHRTQ